MVIFSIPHRSVTLENSTIIGEKDYIDNKDGSGDNNEIDGNYQPNGQESPPSNETNSTVLITK